MKAITTKIVAALMVMALWSMSDAKAQTNLDSNYYHLTSGRWDLRQIELNGTSYSDPVYTDLTYTFFQSPPNLAHITVSDSTVSTTFQLAGANREQLILNPGVDQQILLIEVLDKNLFVYTTRYLIEGIEYIYRFKMIKV